MARRQPRTLDVRRAGAGVGSQFRVAIGGRSSPAVTLTVGII